MLDYDISGKAGMTVTVTGKGTPPPINPLVENVSRTVVAKLESVMWEFEDAKTNDLIHNIHPYPAKFIPQIPRELIRLFHPGRGQVVFDPFCGSGTTLVESVAAGIPAVGVDLNPLAVLISKVKTNLPGKMISPVARQIVGAAHQENVPIPDIPRLDHWFLPDVQQVLSCLVRQINLIEEIDDRDALKITLSRIIVRVSNQDSDTRYAAVKKDINKNQVYDLFVKSAEAIDRAIAKETGNLFRSNSTCRVLHRDILDVSPEDIGCNVGLVVTSPPYPNAYEYWLYHKYRMYWLGMDPIAVRSAEIGARPHYFKKNHQTEDDFERQMGQTFRLLSRIMLKGAVACFLVGRSIIHGRHVDNCALLERAAALHGFRQTASVSRKILATRKAFNPAHGKINEESIVLFVLEGIPL